MSALASARRETDAQKGIACVVAVTFCFACMDGASKYLSAFYDPLFVVWARYAVQAAGTLLVFAPRLRQVMRTERLWLQIIRSALLFSATICFFYGFSLMPLVQVAAVAQTAPLIITALAALVLGEQVGPYRWGGVVVGFLGALVILAPEFGADAFGWAALFPLAGAAFFAGYSVATRFLGAGDSVWTTFLYTGSVGAVAASVIAPSVWATPAWEHVPIFLAMGAFGAFGQLLLIVAMSFAPASLLAPYLYSSLIWSGLAGWLLFGEIPGAWTLIGGAMIVGAGLFVQHRERVRGRASVGG